MSTERAIPGISEAGRRTRHVRKGREAGPHVSAYDRMIWKRFGTVMRDMQDFPEVRSSADVRSGLEIISGGPTHFHRPFATGSLFRNADVVLEVAASQSWSTSRKTFRNCSRSGLTPKLNEIVHANLPGVPAGASADAAASFSCITITCTLSRS